MPITPGGRWSPADSDDWDLTTDLAAMQVSNEAASATEIAAIPKSFRSGLNSARLALTGTDLVRGMQFQTTDNGGFLWVNNLGTTTGWRVAPGQVLASMMGPNAATSGNGTIHGTVASTIVLPLGQQIKVTSRFGQYASAGQNSTVFTTWRNNATSVSYTVYDGRQATRVSTAGAGFNGSGAGAVALFTTTAAARVTAAIYSGDANSAVYGQDGSMLLIESA